MLRKFLSVSWISEPSSYVSKGKSDIQDARKECVPRVGILEL